MIPGIWQEFIKLIKQELGSQMVETWLKAVSLLQWDAREKVVLLQTPNTFVKDWLAAHYLPLFEYHLARLFNVETLKIILVDAPSNVKMQEKRATQPWVNEFAHMPKPEQVRKPSQPVEPKTTAIAKAEFIPATTDHTLRQKTSLIRQAPVRLAHLNANYTFDSFVVGPHNHLAYAAAQAVTEKPGVGYNPLFIYAASGLGKTHLLHAIGNTIKERFNRMTVLYQTTDRFVQEFINAIRFDQVNQFQTKYKTVDVLLIDDVQTISNKEQTQEAFFHIFNALYDAHKQLVFSSDTYPQHINGIAQRLRSRLEWGLIVDIQPPAIETKIAILKKKAAAHEVTLTDDVAQFLAARSGAQNIRALEGALIQLIAVASLTKQPVTVDLAKKVLTRVPTQDTPPLAPELETIVKCVCDHYSLSLQDIRSASKAKDLARARQVAMYLMKKMTTKSLQEIGCFLGRKDHSTVIHALEKIQTCMSESPDFSAQLLHLEEKILS